MAFPLFLFQNLSLAKFRNGQEMSLFSNYNIGPDALKDFEIAYEYQMQGAFEKAVFHYLKSLEIEQTAEGYTFLGWTYSFMGRIDEAIEQCQKAIRLDPEFGNPYNDIGAYLMQIGEIDEAIHWFEKTKLAKRYETPEFAYCNLGKAYELKGLWPLARKEYQKALEIRGDYPAALAALDKLEILLN